MTFCYPVKDCLALVKKTKEIFCVEYWCQCRTRIAVYQVPFLVLGTYLIIFLLQFEEIMAMNTNHIHGDWNFQIMIDGKIFNSIFNYLNVKKTAGHHL